MTLIQLVAKITANTASAEAGIIRTANTAKAAFAPMAMLGAGTALAAVAVGVAATKMAGDFQAGITTLQTGAGESQKNLKLVSDGILQMAKDTGTSTKQLTDGMFMIESAGYHGSDGLKVLQAAAMGAKVGNADLGTVADAVTTIMTDFGIKSKDSAQAVNALIATVANGKTHMQDLGQSLAMILPTASAAHVGLNDVMGAMATMTGEGVPAANAATYLRQMIIALDAPSGQAKKALEGIGLTTDQVSKAMQKSLPDALKMITEHLKKKFPEGSAAYVQALRDISGGSREMQGMLDLTGTHLGTFGDNVKKIGGAVKQGGSNISGWSEVQKTFNFQVSRAKEVAETLMIQLGQKLLPVATQLFSFIADKAIPALSGFVHWISGSSTSANIIRPILAGLAIVIGGALVASFIAWAGAAALAAIGTIAATWPVLAIGAGIALLITGIILLVKHWKNVTDFLGGIWKATVAGVQYDIHAVGGAFNGLGTLVSNVGKGLGAAIKGGINMVIGDLNGFIRFLDGIQIHIPAVGVGPVHSPAFDWNGVGLGQIPYLAEGGTAQRAGLAVVGERGPELLSMPRGASVLPLPSGVPGGNAAASGSSGQPQVIVVQLVADGRKLAETVVRHVPTVVRNATGARSF